MLLKELQWFLFWRQRLKYHGYCFVIEDDYIRLEDPNGSVIFSNYFSIDKLFKAKVESWWEGFRKKL